MRWDSPRPIDFTAHRRRRRRWPRWMVKAGQGALLVVYLFLLVVLYVEWYGYAG